MLIQSSVFARTTCVQEPCLKNMALVESTQPLNLVPLWLAFVTRSLEYPIEAVLINNVTPIWLRHMFNATQYHHFLR